jgi:hypothetical protein
VQSTFLLSGSLSSFDSDAQAAFATGLAAHLDGIEASDITLNVSAASIRVLAFITTREVAAAHTAVSVLTFTNTSQFTSWLGQPVEGVTVSGVGERRDGGTVRWVRRFDPPPPPSPPPPSSAMPPDPSPPTQPLLHSPAPASTLPSGHTDGASSALLTTLAASLTASLVILACCCAHSIWRGRWPQPLTKTMTLARSDVTELAASTEPPGDAVEMVLNCDGHELGRRLAGVPLPPMATHERMSAPPRMAWAPRAGKTYVTFLSHFKSECASSARYLNDLMQKMLSTPVFLGIATGPPTLAFPKRR